MSDINTISARSPQGRRKKFANESLEKQARHREIELEDQRKRRKKGKRLSARDYRRIAELEIVYFDRYGLVLPNDDAGADDAWLMANHLAHRSRPEQRIREWIARRAPWYVGVDWLIDRVMRKPLKWKADKLGELLGLDMTMRTRLGITTIGAVDWKKAKRAGQRRQRNNAAKRAKRAASGSKPHATSASRTKPWKADGVSRRTWYRRRRNGTDGTKTGTACPKDIEVCADQCQGAPPRLKRGSEARAVEDVTETVFMLPREIARVSISVSLASSL